VRVLLDEQLPADLAALLLDHTVALVTMDRGIEFQQNLSGISFGVLLVRSVSNRLTDLRPLVPAILDALATLEPGQLHRVGRV
jgi:hypothetical protein